MNEPDVDINIIEHRSASTGSRLVRHPVEGHVRPDPELKELLDEIKRQQPAAAKTDDADTPNTA